MSVETGIPPQALLALDAEMFDAIVDELERRWTPELELAASGLEISHAAYLWQLRVHGKKGQKLPKPIQIPRPRREEEEPKKIRAPRVSLGEFAGLAQAEVIPAGGEDG